MRRPHVKSNAFFFRTIVFVCLLLAACASLPDLSRLDTMQPPATPTVETGRGPLPPKQAQSLLARRLRNASVSLETLAALEEAATGSPLIAGNKVKLLFDGPQALGAMMKAVAGAQNHINLETYIFDQDPLGLKFADLLMAKQRAGVQVNIIYDSVGTLGTPQAFFERMRAAGIRLVEFNPVNPLKSGIDWRINNRDHRKILVVDGKIGFAGGVNIAKDYSHSSLFRSSSKNKAGAELGWRDTHVQIEGPAVASLQWLFLDTWTSQTTDDLQDRQYFPPPHAVGDKIVRIIGSKPGGNFEIFKSYAVALRAAKQSIHLTNAYFAPDAQIFAELLNAARRGVDVKIIFPSVSDAGLAYYAGRSFYADLLDAGVKVYELKASVLHAKTAVVDGAWSVVGSANLDVRSFLHNSEVNVVVLGTDFGAGMEAAFREDLRNSIEVGRREWTQRGLAERIKEWAARRLQYWL